MTSRVQSTPQTAPCAGPRYSVRIAEPNGSIDTLGAFQQHRTASAARHAAMTAVYSKGLAQ